MKIVRVSAIPMSAPVPAEKRHRTDLGTKVKSDATLIRVETDNGLTGIGTALGTPPIVAAIVEHELAPEAVGEDPMFSERIYEKMYNGSRSKPALERGVTQADESRRRGVIMEAIAGVMPPILYKCHIRPTPFCSFMVFSFRSLEPAHRLFINPPL